MSNKFSDADAEATIVQYDEQNTDKTTAHLNDDDNDATIIQAYKPKAKETTATIDDVTLLQKFARGETELLANQELRLEHSFNRLQLTTRNSQIIALMNLSDEPRSVLMKPLSKHSDILHKTLVKNDFILLDSSDQQGFLKYEQYVPPDGYKINYTEVGCLWKAWWLNQRRQNQQYFKLNLLILSKKKWHPIQDIVLAGEVFYIKNVIGEIILHNTDKVIWANKINNNLSYQEPPGKRTLPTASNAKLVNLEEVKKAVTYEKKDQHVLPDEIQADLAVEFAIENDPDKLLKVLKAKALKQLSKYLDDGMTKTKIKEKRNERGELISTETVIYKQPCPLSVIEYLLEDV